MDIDMDIDMDINVDTTTTAIYLSDASTTESFTPSSPTPTPALLTPFVSPTDAAEDFEAVDHGVALADADKRQNRSPAWLHFRKADDYAATRKATCMHCGKTLVASNGSTSTMLVHLQRKHAEAFASCISANSLSR